MIGVAVLTALDKLEAADLLRQDSAIKNIPLVFSMYLKIADDCKDAMDVLLPVAISIRSWNRWPDRIVAYAQHHNIELSDETGIKNTNKLVQKFGAAKYDKFPAKRKGGEDRWGYKRVHKGFIDAYGYQRYIIGDRKFIGGDAFDITKMDKEERIEKSYIEDGKDPLDEMGPPPEGIWKF